MCLFCTPKDTVSQHTVMTMHTCRNACSRIRCGCVAVITTVADGTIMSKLLDLPRSLSITRSVLPILKIGAEQNT